MAIERNWESVPAQTILANGTAEGFLQVSDPSLFKVKQKVKLFSDAVSPVFFVVNRVVPTGLYLGTPDKNIREYANLSIWLVSDNAKISAEEQVRSSIIPDAYNRAMYEEEPVVGQRSVLVDKLGRKIDSEVGDDGKVRLSTTANVTIDEINIGDIDVALDSMSPPNRPDPDNVMITGSVDGTKTGTKYGWVNNVKQQIMAAHDRKRDAFYLDISSKKDRRLDKFEYTSPTFPGVTLVRQFSWTLVGTEYVYENDEWSVI